MRMRAKSVDIFIDIMFGALKMDLGGVQLTDCGQCYLVGAC